jgi:hypothetical protein
MKVETPRWAVLRAVSSLAVRGVRNCTPVGRLFGLLGGTALANVLAAALVTKAALAGGEVVALLVELLDGLAGAGAALALLAAGGGLDGLALVLAAALIAETAAAGEEVLAHLVGGIATLGGLGLAATDLAVLLRGLDNGALVLATAVITELAAAALEVAAHLLWQRGGR